MDSYVMVKEEIIVPTIEEPLHCTKLLDCLIICILNELEGRMSLHCLRNEIDLIIYSTHFLSAVVTYLGVGLPRYTASLCLFETLFSRRYGVSVKDCTLRYTCTPEEHEQFPDGCTDVTDINAPLAISAAINACDGRYIEY